MNLDEAADEMMRLSRLIDQGLTALRDQARELADSEHAYRLAKSLSYVQHTEGTAAAREAAVNGATADLRHRRDLADSLRQAALEAVRSRRAQLSALQTLLNAYQEEAKFSRTGVAA